MLTSNDKRRVLGFFLKKNDCITFLLANLGKSERLEKGNPSLNRTKYSGGEGSNPCLCVNGYIWERRVLGINCLRKSKIQFSVDAKITHSLAKAIGEAESGI